MSNSYFKFKQFTIYQDRCAMKVGTDGVLLGAWADVSSAHSILDIGTGTGLISIMLAQRCMAEITAIEIDEEAAQQATENIAASKWKDRITVVNRALQEFSIDASFDHIVSNPPYFNQALKSPEQKRTTARHTESLSYHDLLAGVNHYLQEDGIFSIILPFSEKDRFYQLAEAEQLYPCRETIIYSTPDSQPKRFMAEFQRKKTDFEPHSLIIEAYGRHQYSEAYKKLTEDFYL